MPRRTLSLKLVAALVLVSLAHAASPAADTADILLPEDSARQHAVVYTASPEPTAPSLLLEDGDDAQAPLEPASKRVPLPFRLPHGPRRLKRSTADADALAFPELARRAEPNLGDRASSVRASRSAAAAAGAGGDGASSAVAPAPAVPETTTTAQLPGSKGVVSTGLLTRATASAATTASSAAVEADAASDAAGGGGATVTAFATASTGVVVTSFASASAGTLESALDGGASSAASFEPATALVNSAAGARAASWISVGVGAAGALVALAMH
ncbi:hypothetical protein JCM9279_003904 [Rhodotorula babjevae]